MDFYQIKERSTKSGTIEVFPDFTVCRSKDLMTRGKAFYAIWDQKKGLWSTDEYDVQRLVDEELREYKTKLAERTDGTIHIKAMSDFSSRSWAEFKNYISHIADTAVQLDARLTFANTEVKKKDYVSRRLSYSLEKGNFDAFDEIIGTLYDPEERRKLEWAIGSIVAGDAKDIQKFIVLYGEAGGGKSTILNIIQKLFEGYYTTFEAKALTSSNNGFSTEVFRSNPLVAIQHDGDLSRIEDNTKLNSIVSHEEMTMNEKYKPSYTSRANCFLFIGTNKPVKITDAKSGIIRRLIDVRTSGRKIPTKRYHELMSRIDFELGAIAYHCLDIYQNMGKNYYSTYRPLDMILQTDTFYNFVEANYQVFIEQGGATLSQAYEMYKSYCDEALVDFKLPRHKFREELKNYFEEFYDVTRVDGRQIRSYYSVLKKSKFTTGEPETKQEEPSWLVLDDDCSIFDEVCSKSKAQYANDSGTPINKWGKVETTLSDIDTKKLHWVMVPEKHVVIDFDLKDEQGKKSPEKNMEAASKWPPTYAEYSKSGAGIHLHYIYDGDPARVSSVYEDGIEIKVFNGLSSLRRKLTKCNSLPIRTINSGLPLKEEKVIDFNSVKNEKAIRTLIKKNLNKEIHPATKPSIDFIYKILEEAHASGIHYDVTDMRPDILVFANNSTNNSDYCLTLVTQMKFRSDEPSANVGNSYESDDLVFFDVEVFPNVFIVAWKYQGDQNNVVYMIDPSPKDIETLLRMKLVGFNCRRYDNHILYARYIGYDNQELFVLSQRIINESRNSMFSEAYNLSYTDVYDFASAGNKKSLKKYEIELGLHHIELGLPWDQPISEKDKIRAAEYCGNDVIATEKVFDHLSGDWIARQILAELSGLSVNDTTNQHSTKIIFGDNKKPQDQFVYTNLDEEFPGYKFEMGKSYYRGEEPGEGGYVYAEPGAYTDVALLDVASMHPTSIEQLNLFGEKYTRIYSEIKSSRLAIKHNDRESLKSLLGGRLVPFIERSDRGEFKLKDLSNALKTVVNSVYGLTSAKFDNPFRDPRNIDNIVAKRGALFMIDLKNAVQSKGYTVAHIKTDSIKIPNANKEIIDFVFEFGKKYGYEFEHEGTYDRFCLVNDAVYIARNKTENGEIGEWTATGAQFAHPFVFKTLFSKEPIEFEDLCETKSVTTALYLDMNEGMSDGEHNYVFVGKVGLFCPIQSGRNGGILLRIKGDKYYSVGGTKGYRWLESEMVSDLGKEADIDMDYFRSLADDARKDISKYVNFDEFVS